MKSTQRKYYSDAEKASLVKAYQASGMLKYPWCKENGISLSNLQRWLNKENNTDQQQPQQNWACAIPTVPVKSKVLEIKIGKCTIPIDQQTDLSLLASVLKVLVEAAC